MRQGLYKAGDRVRLKDAKTALSTSISPGVNQSMQPFFGQIVTIVAVSPREYGHIYKIAEDDCRYVWNSDWFHDKPEVYTMLKSHQL